KKLKTMAQVVLIRLAWILTSLKRLLVSILKIKKSMMVFAIPTTPNLAIRVSSIQPPILTSISVFCNLVKLGGVGVVNVAKRELLGVEIQLNFSSRSVSVFLDQ